MPQNYANHKRVHTVFHRVLVPVIFLTVIGAGVNLWLSLGDHQRLYSASLILVLSICLFVLAICARMFALTAQDRAIRAEENFRHFLLAGKPLDPRLSIRQVTALRFASDGEFPALAARAAAENLAPDAIKRSVKDWRADEHRV
jgi:hypothetical protein